VDHQSKSRVHLLRRSWTGRLTSAVVGVLIVGSTAAVSSGETAAAATNACSNPVLASNLNGWGTLDGSWTSRDTVGDLAGVSWAFDTGGREFYLPGLNVSAGQSWTFSAKDRVVFGSGTAMIGVDWYTSSGSFITEQTGAAISLPASTATGGTWTTVSATFTVPSAATSAHVVQYGDFGSAAGTNFKATACDYELGTTTPSSTQASVRYGWGTPNASQSDEYNGTTVDLTKWGRFGTSDGVSGCSAGFDGHGQRCGSQTTESGGYLSVSGTAGGVTGGLWSNQPAFRYGRVEVRERAVNLGTSGKAYHAVPLLWPTNGDYTHAEIDFAERDVASPEVDLFVHHDGGQDSCAFTVDSTQFHNYAVDWQPTSVTWYVDAVKVCTINASIAYYDNTNGGAQLDMLPATGPMRPAREDVDWIHMYPVASTTYQ
jgi:hypothetical protein